MRYVIAIVAVAFFVIWDGLYNRGMYLDQFFQSIVYLMRSIGL